MIWIFDFIILMLFSFPVFIGYIVGILVYFYKFDKKPPKINGTPPNGLSRFCLKGIMFLFGLILFDLIIQFFVSYSMLFVERYGYETGIPFGLCKICIFNFFKKNRYSDNIDQFCNSLYNYLYFNRRLSSRLKTII